MLPEMYSTSKPEQKAMAEYDARKKEQMKCCADNIRGAKESSIKPGDTALLKQKTNSVLHIILNRLLSKKERGQ